MLSNQYSLLILVLFVFSFAEANQASINLISMLSKFFEDYPNAIRYFLIGLFVVLLVGLRILIRRAFFMIIEEIIIFICWCIKKCRRSNEDHSASEYLCQTFWLTQSRNLIREPESNRRSLCFQKFEIFVLSAGPVSRHSLVSLNWKIFQLIENHIFQL